MKRRNNTSLSKDNQQEGSNSKRNTIIKKRALQIVDQITNSANESSANSYAKLIKAYKQSTKRPILQTLSPIGEIFRTNPDRKKKPIQQYLDTINTIYKKKDLDMLINPINVVSIFENWAPREIAVFEGAIVRFGNQFDFISQLIGTKSAKQCYQFYWQWKNTSHFKAYKTNQNLNNRSYEQYM